MSGGIISSVIGYEVLDSRGNPTVAAKVVLNDKSEGFAISPSGASTGIFEAHELRDNEEERYNGLGTRKAVENINFIISKAIIGENATEQGKIDEIMISLDATDNKSKLGANAILAVSLAVSKAAAKHLKIPYYEYISRLSETNGKSLPRPMMNILNGGAHASNNIDIQEFMIIPFTAESFAEGLRQCSEIYHCLGKLLKQRGLLVGVGDEGGFAPSLNDDEEALKLICEAISSAGYTTDNIKIALDIASSEWYNGGRYMLPKRKREMDTAKLIEYYKTLIEKYPIISIEDGFAEEDFDSWKLLTKELGEKIQLVGDDLFVTNTNRLKIGIEEKLGNSILIKPNQIGSLSETLEVIKLAKENGITTVISHRSGESEDTTIADLAVGVNAGQIKTGAPCRSDRVSKYNRLLIIEQERIKG